MPNYNKVILMGNLTRDPEVREVSGNTIARLGLAGNRSWRNKEGQQQEETVFVDVDAFGRQAETIAQYLKKGRPIMIEGRLKLDQWEDKQTGQKRSKMGVVLDRFEFIDSRGEVGANENKRGADTPQQPQSPPSAGQGEDDVPF